ncbi:amphi-Trp domain-containing protein [Streptomyces sp. NPDC094437]|uniref:amphi-Trp domain-containing protein n=1 Tax=Streptomyces sp. NPDC094437 TaxID=3366060 RepID=UPI00380D4F0F
MNWPDAEMNEIRSREDLAAYLQNLANAISDGRVVLENPSSTEFIEASARWTKAMDGFFGNVVGESVPDSPSWAMIAAMFRAAVTYE